MVEAVTDYETTHVAIVLDGKVYNAEPPRVKTYTVSEYLETLAAFNGQKPKSKTLVCKPKRSLTQKEKQAMREYLENQV